MLLCKKKKLHRILLGIGLFQNLISMEEEVKNKDIQKYKNHLVNFCMETYKNIPSALYQMRPDIKQEINGENLPNEFYGDLSLEEKRESRTYKDKRTLLDILTNRTGSSHTLYFHDKFNGISIEKPLCIKNNETIIMKKLRSNDFNLKISDGINNSLKKFKDFLMNYNVSNSNTSHRLPKIIELKLKKLYFEICSVYINTIQAELEDLKLFNPEEIKIILGYSCAALFFKNHFKNIENEIVLNYLNRNKHLNDLIYNEKNNTFVKDLSLMAGYFNPYERKSLVYYSYSLPRKDRFSCFPRLSIPRLVLLHETSSGYLNEDENELKNLNDLKILLPCDSNSNTYPTIYNKRSLKIVGRNNDYWSILFKFRNKQLKKIM